MNIIKRVDEEGIQEWIDTDTDTGLRHRDDGPAIIYGDESELQMWWYQGKFIDCSSQEEFERLLKLKAFW